MAGQDVLLVGEKEIIRYLISKGVTPADPNKPDRWPEGLKKFLLSQSVVADGWLQARVLVAVQQLMFRDVGANPGTIDGLVGPQTLYALEQWQNKVRDAEVPKSVVKQTLIAPVWPRERDIEKFYSVPGTGHTQLVLPYPMKLAWDVDTEVHRITIHQKCAASAGRVLARVLEHYGMKEIRRLGFDQFGGCYNNRPKRGGTSKSMHAYACAIDFDPVRNQLRWGRDRARLALPSCNKWWEFWEEEGWVSLGRERNYDYMHVQAANL